MVVSAKLESQMCSLKLQRLYTRLAHIEECLVYMYRFGLFFGRNLIDMKGRCGCCCPNGDCVKKVYGVYAAILECSYNNVNRFFMRDIFGKTL